MRLNRPDIPLEQLERTRRLMNQHALEALVSGYEERIHGLTLPDSDDRHVVAAALHTGAKVIVTFNLKDFPPSTLEPLGEVAQHPDLFALELLSQNRDKVLEALSNQRRLMVRAPMTALELLKALSRQGLERTVQALITDTDRI